jgi:hypothetical protein
MSEKTNVIPRIDSATLVGLACHLGTTRAIEFAEFATTCGELADDQKKLLLRGWLAVQHLPKDASLEASDLHKCLAALRMAFCTIKYMEPKK